MSSSHSRQLIIGTTGSVEGNVKKFTFHHHHHHILSGPLKGATSQYPLRDDLTVLLPCSRSPIIMVHETSAPAVPQSSGPVIGQ